MSVTTNWKTMVHRDDVDFELREIDEKILGLLEEGRCTRRYLGEQLGVTGEYVYQRVDLMSKLGIIRVIHDGFYELADETPGDVDEATEPDLSPEPESETDDLRARMEDALAALEIPGRSETVEETRRDAIRWAWEYLRDAGEAKSRDIANATFEEFRDEKINYKPSKSRFDGYGLWDNCVRDALKELPGVEGPGDRGDTWFFNAEK